MTDLTKNQLITDLAYDVVSELAPNELPMFPARSKAYIKDPNRIYKSKSSKDEMLGFGPEIAVSIVTPAILAVATTVVNFVVEAVKDPVQEGMKDILGEGVKSVFEKVHTLQKESEVKKDESNKSVSEVKKEESKKKVSKDKQLTPEQLKQVRKLAVQQAIQLGISEQKAHTLADSLLGRLAVQKQ